MRVHHSDSIPGRELQDPHRVCQDGTGIQATSIFPFCNELISILVSLYFKVFGKEMEIDDHQSSQWLDKIVFQI